MPSASSVPSIPRALHALIDAIKDPDDDVREEVVFAIGEIGTGAKPTLDALRSALQDSSHTVRAAAQEAIEKLQGDDADVDQKKKANNPAGAQPKKR